MNNFAVLAIAYTHYDSGLYVCVKTNIPCHLTCYWTFKTPLRHKVTRTIRGLATPWGAYFCFVGWTEVEQIEAGDTIYHRFNLSTWQPPNTAWLAFRGTVNAALSPSVSPIFEHYHPGGLPMNVPLLPTSPGDLCQANTGVPNACPDHYLNVNEATPDEDISYVEQWLPAFTGVKFDLYHIATAAVGKIDQVMQVFRAKRVGGIFNESLVGHVLKTHATQYNYPYVALSTNYVNRFRFFPNNPFTNLPWTQTEINSLQIGLSFTWRTTLPRLSKGRVTQTYLIVQRGINCPDD